MSDYLALEMVRHARGVGSGFGWVGADSLYGNDPALPHALDEDGETFMVDVHKDYHMYVEEPRPRVPASPSRGMHNRSPRMAQSEPVCVNQRLDIQPRCGNASRYATAPRASCGCRSCVGRFGYGMAKRPRRATGI
jgi:hypothetical protein